MRVEIKSHTSEFPLNFIPFIIDRIYFGAIEQMAENAVISV